MTIENTQAPSSIHATTLLALATGETSAIIEGQERAGQTQLVHSTQLPTDLHSAREDFEAVGFTFGDITPHDPMFMEATLPVGWKREGSDHAMWSYIVDEHDRRRVSIFYKAAFYDRSAFMSLATVYAYLSDCMHKGVPVVTDEVWATREAVVEAALRQAKYAEEQVEFWSGDDHPKYVAKYTAERDKYEALAAEHA